MRFIRISSRERDEGGKQPHDLDVIGVEQRDHQDGADVVGDGERNEEHLERRRDSIAEKREHTECEGDVGRHRHAPPLHRRGARVESEVDGGGGDHAADGGNDRQRGALHRGKLADNDLSLDLQADHEEEERHERVVDPVKQRLLELQTPDVEAGVGVPELVVAHPERRVGDEERRHRSDRQDDRAGHLLMHELREVVAHVDDRVRAFRTGH